MLEIEGARGGAGFPGVRGRTSKTTEYSSAVGEQEKRKKHL
jgi:hypothetical protein